MFPRRLASGAKRSHTGAERLEYSEQVFRVGGDQNQKEEGDDRNECGDNFVKKVRNGRPSYNEVRV